MQQRLVAAESKEERATRLENVQPDLHLPPFEQRCVQSEKTKTGESGC